MLNIKYPHHPPLHSTNCSVCNQGSVASAGITSPGFPPPLSFCPFNLHSTNVVTISVSTFVQTGASPRTVSNRPGSVSLWTLALPPTLPPIPSQDVYQTESCTPTETQLSLVNAGTIKVVLRQWTRQAIIILTNCKCSFGWWGLFTSGVFWQFSVVHLYLIPHSPWFLWCAGRPVEPPADRVPLSRVHHYISDDDLSTYNKWKKLEKSNKYEKGTRKAK